MPPTPNPTPDFHKLTDSQKMLIISVALNDHQNKLERFSKILITGNGELPLPERVRNIETYVNSLKFWGRFIGTSLVLQTLAFLAGIIVALARFLPVLERLANNP